MDALTIAGDNIKLREGFSPTPYKDAHGVWTIGYGSTRLRDGTPVSSRTPAITQDVGVLLMEDFISRFIVPKLKTLHNWDRLNANQQAACISMAYNIGPVAFVEQSAVARDIEGWVLQRVPADMMHWVYVTVNGRLTWNRGLSNRRQAEGKLFLTPVADDKEGV